VEWHYAIGGVQQGPISWEELKSLAQAGKLAANDLVWKRGMQGWVAASLVPDLIPPGVASPPLPGSAAMPASANSDRVMAGILAILLGALGIHKFMLGMTTPGLIMLLTSILTCGLGWPVMHIIGIIEGVIYLSKTDADFYQTYVVDKRNWF
jgi:TM2 domain-containing membrane protein YozV